jgi:hypothetical protein
MREDPSDAPETKTRRRAFDRTQYQVTVIWRVGL